MENKRPVREYSVLRPTTMPEQEYYQPEYPQNYRRKNPRECLLLSILAIFCCLPLGIVAVILSIKTREANRINDSETARKYSKWTITSSLLAIGFGVISAIFCLIMIIGIVGVTSIVASELAKCIANSTLCNFDQFNKTIDLNSQPQFDQNESIIMNTIDHL